MALVSILDSDTLKRIGSTCQKTDIASFLYGQEKCVQLIMTRSPEVMHLPKGDQAGTIRINKHKTVPLNPDNTFYYGAWPQDEVSINIASKLDKEARQTICYYKIKGNTYYEFEMDAKRYAFIHGYDKWFQVQFIKWIYDPKMQKAYTEKALWNADESDDNTLKYFWLQAFQATRKMQQSIQQATSSLKKCLTTGTNSTINSNLNTGKTI